MKIIICYLLTGFIAAVCMRWNSQNFWHYQDTFLVLVLFFCFLAYSLSFNRSERQGLLSLLQGKPLETVLIKQLLARLRFGWMLLFNLLAMFFLAQSVHALAYADDMAHLGAWMALALLGGLYLVLLRWGLFLPLESSLKRRLITAVE